MNSKTAKKIETILAGLRKQASSSFGMQISKINRAHDRPPGIVPSFVVREAVKAALDNVLKLVAQAEIEISLVSATMDAHGLLKAGVLLHLSDLASSIERWNGLPLSPDNLKLVDERFAAVRQDVVSYVDATQHRFKNSGGRPDEWNWDGAAAHIKGSYPRGFKKERGLQSHIAKIMSDWFFDKYGDAPSRSERMRRAAILITEHHYR